MPRLYGGIHCFSNCSPWLQAAHHKARDCSSYTESPTAPGNTPRAGGGGTSHTSVLAYFPYFEKMRVGLCDLRAVCVSYQLLIGWTNLHETWYVHHATKAHLNGVFYKFLPSVRVSTSVSPVVATQWLVKNVTAATNTNATIELLGMSFSIRSVS
jgi:hypothetical protein